VEAVTHFTDEREAFDAGFAFAFDCLQKLMGFEGPEGLLALFEHPSPADSLAPALARHEKGSSHAT
jgi:hypothetical protein